jgi:kynurenine 3-monooxygenase
MVLPGRTGQRIVVVGAGPVGALAALYAAHRGDQVEIYELRGGQWPIAPCVRAS